MPLIVSDARDTRIPPVPTFDEEREGHDVQQVLPLVELVRRVKLIKRASYGLRVYCC